MLKTEGRAVFIYKIYHSIPVYTKVIEWKTVELIG